MDRGAWRAIVHEAANSWTQLKQLSMHTGTLVNFSINNPTHNVGFGYGKRLASFGLGDSLEKQSRAGNPDHLLQFHHPV